jgi:hypothetical protein
MRCASRVAFSLVPAWLTSVIELAVGVGCLGAAWAMWRGRGMRVLAIIFAIAGATAAGHAVWALVTG